MTGQERSVGSQSPSWAAKRALAAAVLVTVLALLVYLRTMAPTITYRHNGADSGDLVTAAINLGVPHPTGYPLYTLIAHLFTRLPGEPARNVNAFSALCAALAVGLVFWVTYHWLATREGDGPLAMAAAWAGAAVFAFGELLWSQATIAEVYSLNALWAAAMLAVVVSAPQSRRPYALALLLGLGLAHHLTVVWLVPALWPYIGALRRWCTPRRALGLLLCLLPGLLMYLYIPLRAGMHPVPNWGQADDLAGFFWLVSGAAYRRYLGGVLTAQALQRFSAWAGIWVRDLGVIGLALALLGLWRGLDTERRFAWFALSYTILLSLYAMLYITSDSYLYLLPVAALLALWMGLGAHSVLGGLQTLGPSRGRFPLIVAALILIALPLLSVASRYRDMDLSADRQAYAFADGVLRAAAPDALILSRGDSQTFSLWYVRYGLRQRPDVAIVDRYLLGFDWYRAELAVLHPPLAAVATAQGASEAATLLVSTAAAIRPVQLAYRDELLLATGTWREEGPLYTLVR